MQQSSETPRNTMTLSLCCNDRHPGSGTGVLIGIVCAGLGVRACVRTMKCACIFHANCSEATPNQPNNPHPYAAYLPTHTPKAYVSSCNLLVNIMYYSNRIGSSWPKSVRMRWRVPSPPPTSGPSVQFTRAHNRAYLHTETACRPVYVIWFGGSGEEGCTVSL